MKINCDKSLYSIKQIDNSIYVYKKIYETKTKKLFLASVIDLFLPEQADYYIPLCIQLSNEDKEVYIDEKGRVKGTEAYTEIIIKNHYEKWKKTYGLAKNIIFTMGVIIEIFIALLYIKAEYNEGLLLCLIAMGLLCICGFTKVTLTNYKRKKHKMIDVEL